MLGRITFILLILTIITGFTKRKKLHENFALLGFFSFLVHLIQNLSFSLECILIIIFFSLTFVTGLKKLKIKNKLKLHKLFAIIVFLLVLIHLFPIFFPIKPPKISGEGIKLPEPRLKGEMTVEETMLKRRSIRNFLDEDLSLEHLSQLLWAAQGITSEWGGRTAPSAGATYPLEVYVLVRRVEGLESGIYHYNPESHTLNSIKSGDYSNELMRAALSQEWVRDGSINLVITADFSRTMSRYGERGRRYVYLEAGHSAQNIYLQATALELGGVVVGAFNDKGVQDVLSIPENHEPIYVIPIGIPS